MSERAREPLFFEDVEEEPEPQPSTESSGSGGLLTAVGSGLGDDEGEGEPPIEVVVVRGDDPGGGGSILQSRMGAAIRVLHNVHSLPIQQLNLSMRPYNCLRRDGLITVGHILRKSEDELLSLRRFSRKCYDELRQRLDEFGIMPREADWDTARRVN
jgi:hypothetical protein